MSDPTTSTPPAAGTAVLAEAAQARRSAVRAAEAAAAALAAMEFVRHARPVHLHTRTAPAALRALLAALLTEFGKSSPRELAGGMVETKSARRISVSVDLNPSTI